MSPSTDSSNSPDPVQGGIQSDAGWDEFVAMVEADRPRFLPGLKRLMDCVVLWLVGNIQAAACETDEKVQRTPCCCGKHSFPTFELETLDWSWEPIVEDGGRHEVDGCMHHELIRGTNIGSVPQGVKEG